MKVPTNKMRKLATLLAVALLLPACNPKGDDKKWSSARTEMEKNAQEMLAEARSALNEGKFNKAKSIVEQMRKDCTLALEAREEGILLMDSIDLMQLRSELSQAGDLLLRHPEDSLLLQQKVEELSKKMNFYKRKLEHDKQTRQQH